MNLQTTVLAGLPALAFPCLLAAAAIADIRRARIPNALNLALAAAFPAAAVLGGQPWADVAWHLACGGAVLAIGLVIAWKGWLGGGDAKMLAAAACWTGFGHLAPFLAVTALAGGLLALPARHRGSLPFGPAIAIGGLAVFPFLEVARPFRLLF